MRGLGWALLHFVWQGAAVAAALGLARVAMRRAPANARYAAACAALAAMLALPVATFFVVRGGESGAAPRTVATAAIPFADDAGTAPAPRFETWDAGRVEAAIPWLVAAWLAGVALLSARFAAALALTRRLRRATREAAPRWRRACEELSERLELRRAVRVCESTLAEVPTVVGWLRPVVLVPAGVFTGLAPRQVEAILAHELAHVRRHDYLVNLLQTAIETLLFYHPAVWWVSRQVREEREHCCDDLAVAVCGDVLTYAKALAELEELRAGLPVLALAATGGSLLRRIERLLGGAPARRAAPAGLACALALVLGAGALAGTRDGEPLATAIGAARASATAFDDVPPPPPPPDPPAPPAPPAPLGPLGPLAPLAPLAPLPATDFDLDLDVDTDADHEAQAAGELTAQEAGEYAALGYGDLDENERKAFLWQDVTPAYIREMQALGYTGIEPPLLVAMRTHGVDAAFVREMRALGFEPLPARALVNMRIHGVSADYVEELRQLGYSSLSWQTLVAGRIHGVSAEFVREMGEAGLSGLSFQQLVAMRIHGVSPDFAREIQGTGYTPTAAQLVAMRIHGVDAAFVRAVVARKGMVSVDEIIRARIHDDDEPDRSR